MIAATLMVRDEATVIADCLGHLLLNLGIDRIYVADNQSSDETPAILRRIARLTGKVVVSHAAGGFHQSAVMTGLIGQATADGARWVLPCDADEFLWFGSTPLQQLCTAPGIGGYIVPVCNFVQARMVRRLRPWAVCTMGVSAIPHGSVLDAKPMVEAGALPFLRINYPTKLLLRAAPSLRTEHGQHVAEGIAGPLATAPGLTLLHAPMRSRDDLLSRVAHGRRMLAIAPNPNIGWHVKRMAAMDAAALDAEWQANSFVPGQNLGRRGMRVDLRLSRIGWSVRAFRRAALAGQGPAGTAWDSPRLGG